MKRPAYTQYYTRKTQERIANALENINRTLVYGLTDIRYVLDLQRGEISRKTAQLNKGLSAICKNTYNENLRTDEVIKLIKEAFPEKEI